MFEEHIIVHCWVLKAIQMLHCYSMLQTLKDKLKFATGVYNYFLVISKILQLKVLQSFTTSCKCKLVTNLMTSSIFGWRYKICIQFHPPYGIPHVYGHLWVGCNYFGNIQNHTTFWNLILIHGSIWLINPLWSWNNLRRSIRVLG